MPETDDHVDRDESLDSLSEACRRHVDGEFDSPLHVSSEEYLGYLTLAQSRREIIFTVEHALEP